MRSASVSLLILTAVGTLAAQPGNQGKKDLDAMQGSWLVQELEYNGEDMKDKFKLTFSIKGDVMTVEGDENIKTEYGKITLKIDPSTKPKCLDLKVADGVQVNVTMEGIYELKGDELRMCVKVFGQDRPSEFKSPDGGSIALIKLKRQKKS